MNGVDGLSRNGFAGLIDNSSPSARLPDGCDDGGAAADGPKAGDFTELLSSLAVVGGEGRTASGAPPRNLSGRNIAVDGGPVGPDRDRPPAATDGAAPLEETAAEGAARSRDRGICRADENLPQGSQAALIGGRRARNVGDAPALSGDTSGGLATVAAGMDQKTPVPLAIACAPFAGLSSAQTQTIEILSEGSGVGATDGVATSAFGAARSRNPASLRKAPPPPADLAPFLPFRPLQGVPGADPPVDKAGDRSVASVALSAWTPRRVGAGQDGARSDLSPPALVEASPEGLVAKQAEWALGGGPRDLERAAAAGAGRTLAIDPPASGKISILDQQTFLPPLAAPPLASQFALLIGAELGTPATAPGSAGDPLGLGRAADMASPAAASVVKTLTLQLQPESFGVVTVSMRFSGGRLDLYVEASNPEAIRLIDGDRDRLAQRLGAFGISMDALVMRTVESAGQAPPALHHAQAGPSASPTHVEPPPSSTPQEGEFSRHDRFARAKDHEPAGSGSVGAVQGVGVGDGRSAGELYI